MKNKFKRILPLVLCAALILSLVVALIPPQQAGAYDVDDFKGKTLSILGDSISTYANVSNNASYNSTISGNAVYYTEGNSYGVTQADTWWQQAMDILGMELCVNNSYSGSCVLDNRGDTAAGYLARSQNLHNTSNENPDIIAVYLGTNDLKLQPVNNSYSKDVGTFESINFSTLIKKSGTSYTYASPATVLEAYAIMIHKITTKYSDAEVYCFTLLPQKFGQTLTNEQEYAVYNDGVKKIAQKYGAIIVDLYNDSSITMQRSSLDYHYANNLHPNAAGMDAITNCFVSAMLNNSKYRNADTTVHSVDYDLHNVYVPNGNIGAAVDGSTLQLDLNMEGSHDSIQVTVTMGGKDITAEALRNQTILIDSVTDDVTITASTKWNAHYRWDNSNGSFQSVVTNGAGYNGVETTLLTDGSYSNGTFSKAYMTLDRTVYLSHDRPWVMEWKGSLSGNSFLFSTLASSNAKGNRFMYWTTSGKVLLGTSDYLTDINTDQYYDNYGIDISAKVNVKNSQTYRLVNTVNADGTNQINLYVNGTDCGALTTKYKGQTLVASNNNTLSGLDFQITQFGTSSFPLNATLDYIEVWENGIQEFTPSAYRWETKNGRLISVSGDGNESNFANLLGGSCSGGMYRGSYFSLSEDVVLMHDRSWCIEWKSTGNWTGGALLFSASNITNSPYAPYLYRRPGSQFVALGQRDPVDAQHENYGVSLSDHNVNGVAWHTYHLINYVENGTNKVYLFVDGVKLGALQNYYVGGTAQGTTSDWVTGKDFTFSYIGTERFPLTECNVSYIQVWEDDGFLHDPTLDTARLMQLLSDEYALTNDGYTADSWSRYQTALTNAQTTAPTSQTQIDQLVRALTDARAGLVVDSGSGQILSIDLISGDSAFVGRQLGLSVTTDPNVTSLTVTLNGTTQTLDVNSAKVQTLQDGSTVKIWMLSIKAPSTAGTYEYTVSTGSASQTKTVTVE